jgi:hypothetical protein
MPSLLSTALAAYVQAHTNNLTVESVDYLAASAPAQMRVVLFVREEVAATAGTDYTLKLTRNDAAYGSALSPNSIRWYWLTARQCSSCGPTSRTCQVSRPVPSPAGASRPHQQDRVPLGAVTYWG